MWLKKMLCDVIVKKTEMIVKKKSRVSKFGIFKIYIFYTGCLFSDGGCFEK